MAVAFLNMDGKYNLISITMLILVSHEVNQMLNQQFIETGFYPGAGSGNLG